MQKSTHNCKCLQYLQCTIFILFFLFVFRVADAKPTKGSLLWKVENVKTKTSSYILGSIHLGKKSMYPLPGFIESAYKDSKSLVLEIDLSKVNPFDLLKLMTYQDTTTLKSQLKPEVYQKIVKVFESNGLSEIMFAKFKPWAAILVAQQNSMKDKLADDIAPGIDVYFMEKATNDNKEVEELETVEFQMNLFDDFNEIANDYIEYSLGQMEDDTELDNIIKAYVNSDKVALNNIINSSKEHFPQYDIILNKVLYERNQKMSEKIAGWLKTEGKTRFIVIGAGHLVGKKSIIDLLSADKDLKVTNIIK